MGNRAVITTKAKEIGVYLHWDGGRDSVEAFLAYCKQRGFRPPERDIYGWASLVTTISNYLGHNGRSIGIGPYHQLDCDNNDNGVYIIEKWEIVGREHHDGDEQRQYDLEKMLKDIDEAQPKKKESSGE